MTKRLSPERLKEIKNTYLHPLEMPEIHKIYIELLAHIDALEEEKPKKKRTSHKAHISRDKPVWETKYKITIWKGEYGYSISWGDCWFAGGYATQEAALIALMKDEAAISALMDKIAPDSITEEMLKELPNG